MQCCPRGSRQLWIRKMSHSMLVAYAILGPMQYRPRGSKQHCKGKNSGISGNVVWTTSGHCLYICSYISGPSYQKNKVMLSLLWKLTETNAEIAVWHSTLQPIKLFVRHHLKRKTFCQLCNVSVAETHAMLSQDFRKVSGPRLHKPLTLNGTDSYISIWFAML